MNEFVQIVKWPLISEVVCQERIGEALDHLALHAHTDVVDGEVRISVIVRRAQTLGCDGQSSARSVVRIDRVTFAATYAVNRMCPVIAEQLISHVLLLMMLHLRRWYLEYFGCVLELVCDELAIYSDQNSHWWTRLMRHAAYR